MYVKDKNISSLKEDLVIHITSFITNEQPNEELKKTVSDVVDKYCSKRMLRFGFSSSCCNGNDVDLDLKI